MKALESIVRLRPKYSLDPMIYVKNITANPPIKLFKAEFLNLEVNSFFKP